MRGNNSGINVEIVGELIHEANLSSAFVQFSLKTEKKYLRYDTSIFESL